MIVGLDIRKPSLNKAFNLSHREQGISQFLANPEHTDLMSLVQVSRINANLSILPGGPIPPNPTELVARESLPQAIDILKKHFDYIIPVSYTHLDVYKRQIRSIAVDCP